MRLSKILKSTTIFFVLIVTSILSKGVLADTLVASRTFTAPGCIWSIAFQGHGVKVEQLRCNGEHAATRSQSFPATTWCGVSASSNGKYRVENGTCIGFKVFRKMATPTPTPTPVPQPIRLLTPSFKHSSCGNWMIINSQGVKVENIRCGGDVTATRVSNSSFCVVNAATNAQRQFSNRGNSTCTGYNIWGLPK